MLDTETKKRFKLPDVSQIGVIVKDIEKTIRYYESALGIGPWVRLDIEYRDRTLRGKPADFKYKMAFASLGPVELELIQPVEGATVYDDLVAKKGEGLHHLGFDVGSMKNIEERLAFFKQQGIEVIQSGRTETAKFAYLDTEAVGGVVFELISRPARRA